MSESLESILVVDDDSSVRETLRHVLKDRGYQVTLAKNGDEALERLREQEYSLVLTDLRMPGMQGIELMRKIQRAYPDVGVIIMTAYGTIDTAIEAMSHGAADYLIKPFAPEELFRVTERARREPSVRHEAIKE